MSVGVDMSGIGISPPAAMESVPRIRPGERFYSLLGKVRSDELRMSGKMIYEWKPLVDHRHIVVLSDGA